jgi:malonate transporter and related proteins
MSSFLALVQLALPLFVLVGVGYGLMRFGHWPADVSLALSRFVFSLALPAMLFHLMSDLSRLPPVDWRVLLAFFGSCLIVFAIARVAAWKLFRLDGTAQSVFALGAVFSNNALLGLPLARVTLGPEALPTVALVLVFNALTLWTLLTVSVEWSLHGQLSAKGFVRTARGVLTNPLVAAILIGTGFGLTGLRLPAVIGQPLAMLSDAAVPLSLLSLGMSLAEHGVRAGWRIAVSITALKLLLQPLVVYVLARLLGLAPRETQVVVMLGSIAVGANVYLMSRQFKTLEGPVASSLVLSTALSAFTTPLALHWVGAQAPP